MRMHIDWEKHVNKLVDRATEVATGAFGVAAYHFISEKTKEDGTPVTGIDGKPVRTLDLSKFREHAPHFAKTVEDVAAFNSLVTELQPALQKQLEVWMANRGDHQRGDLIINTVAISKTENGGGRDRALNNLRQIAEITPDVFKTRRAVAFRLMKADEHDYLGAQLTEQASAALVAAIAEFHKTKRDWDRWAKRTTRTIDTDANRIERARVRRERVRTQRGLRGLLNRFNRSRRRLSAFPWD